MGIYTWGGALERIHNFHVKSWLQTKTTPAARNIKKPALVFPSTPVDSFNPKNYLIPGWNGQCLISKSGLKLKKIFELITEDVKQQMAQANFNKSLKVEVYHEFLSYAEDTALQCPYLDSLSSFFKHLNNENSPYAKDLDDFKKAFAARVATVYLFKIRFLVKLSQTLKQKIYQIYLQNPNSYFIKLFRQGSSSQLQSPAITANHYSWYRPQINLMNEEFDIVSIYQEVSIGEVQKIFSPNNYRSSQEADYSHTLSHLNFGILLSQLMTQYPQWLAQENATDKKWSLSSQLKQIENNILTVQYCGDHLESLSLSHLLAQAESYSNCCPTIICPEFHSPQYRYGAFARLTYELQFLCLLVDTAQHLQRNPISFICETYRMKENSKQVVDGQQSLFTPTAIPNNRCAYDRIVLNAGRFPKNNPHHFLINQIQAKLPELKVNGFIIVLSRKKLFVPSLSERVEELLKQFKLESVLTFEDLKGRGEAPRYIYILSKRDKIPIQNEGIQKHPCRSFRVSGVLKTFSHFSIINQAIKEFFKNQRLNSTPVHRRELHQGFTFEFYQDAMIDGHLINTTNTDTSKVTHPNFFKNLVHSCYPLSYFFQIEHISTEKERPRPFYSQNLLGIHLGPEDKYSHILILDYRTRAFPCLEFISSDSLKSKMNQYGHAGCSYFGLIPKIRNINIDLFRYFFNTSLGHQILHLSLNEGFSRLKAKMMALLVPKFFEQSKTIPQHIADGLQLYGTSTSELLKCNTQELHKSYTEAESLSWNLTTNYPWHIMGLLVLFQRRLDDAIETAATHDRCFEDGNFINELVKFPTQLLYPNNAEVFIKFHTKKNQEIISPLKKISTNNQECYQGNMHGMQLYSESGPILSLYSHKNMIKFLQFILSRAEGKRISDILNYTKVPVLADLNKLIEQQGEREKILDEITQANQKILSRLINRQLCQENPSI